MLSENSSKYEPQFSSLEQKWKRKDMPKYKHIIKRKEKIKRNKKTKKKYIYKLKRGNKSVK